MDIVTHALMGTALAGPCLMVAPAASLGFILGSVIPDIDVFSRVFGKRSFMIWHQTFTHSIGAILIVATIGLISLTIMEELGFLILAGSLGMLFHSLLDYTNTYGVKLLYPFSNQRYCREWTFFIDVPIFLLTVIAVLGFIWTMQTKNGPSPWQAGVYFIVLILYFVLKYWIRKSSIDQMEPSVDSFIPSAFYPWLFLGYRQEDAQSIQLIDYSWLSGRVVKTETIEILDEKWLNNVSQSVFFNIMRELSKGYHIVEAEHLENDAYLVRCRDLRTRNFNTTFGELELIISGNGKIISDNLNHVMNAQIRIATKSVTEKRNPLWGCRCHCIA